MSKRRKNILVGFILGIFATIILAKPIHLMFHDHLEDSAQTTSHHNSKTHDDCIICQFTFGLSTEAELHAETVVFENILEEISSPSSAEIDTFIIKHTSPRAPPAFLS